MDAVTGWFPSLGPLPRAVGEEEKEPLTDLELYQIERDFAETFLSKAKSRLKDPSAICEEDLFFDMFLLEQPHNDPESYAYGWCMSTDHLIAQVMRKTHIETREHYYAPVCVAQLPIGSIVVYTDAQVNGCVADIVALCKKHSLTVVPAAIVATPLPDRHDPLQVISKKVE